MDYQPFFSFIEKEADKFRSFLSSSKNIRVITHLDADGLCSGGIISRCLFDQGKRFHVSVVKQLTDDLIRNLDENYDLYIFTDLGSGKLLELSTKFRNKKLVILDHHPPNANIKLPNMIHINPHDFGIDGGLEISASTLVYLFCKYAGFNVNFALPVVGTLGDLQEKEGELIGVNKEVIESLPILKIKKDLRIFGRNSKPLYKALAYSSEGYIPGVSGDESTSVQFLSELGIDLKKEDGSWKTLNDLSQEDYKKLVSAIILKRMGKSENPQDIFGNYYEILVDECPFKDAREFATFLNACGRQHLQSTGLLLCMGFYDSVKDEISSVSNGYKKKIVNNLRWYEDNKESEKVVEDENAIFIFADGEIPDTMIGTTCSMILSTTKKPFVVGFADSDDGVKVSVRTNTDIDVGSLVTSIVEEIGGSDAGGHSKAGGAKIKKGYEREFMRLFREKVKNINDKTMVENER